MPGYYIWTIGCQMNKAESGQISACLEQDGFLPARTPQDAEIIVLNSCVVRQSAEDKVINKLKDLRALKRVWPDKKIALTGCLVDSRVDTLKKDFPQVDYFFKPGEALPWITGNGGAAIPNQPGGVTAFVPIIQGCDHFCAYCIVPFRRGRERSRPVAEIVCEVERLVSRGTREVTLLGQNVDSFGHDLPGAPDLADLLRELDGLDNLKRIRFLTNHPKDMSRRIIDAAASLDKVCEQIVLPVQSGNNEILESMRRGYTIEHYRSLVADIRDRIRGVALTTDIIVGFPSETHDQFRQTVELLSEIKFDTVHVAAYSPRAGTFAARELDDNVPPEVKRSRLAQVEALQEKIASEINGRLTGQTVEVLVEGMSKGKWQGRTRTDKPVFFSSEENLKGQLVPVKIIHTSAWSLQGEIEKININVSEESGS